MRPGGGHGIVVVVVVDIEELVDVEELLDVVVVLVDLVVVVLGGLGWGQMSTVKVAGGVATSMIPTRRRSRRSARAQSFARRDGGTPSAESRESEQTVRERVQAIGRSRRCTSGSRSVRIPMKPPIADDGDRVTSAWNITRSDSWGLISRVRKRSACRIVLRLPLLTDVGSLIGSCRRYFTPISKRWSCLVLSVHRIFGEQTMMSFAGRRASAGTAAAAANRAANVETVAVSGAQAEPRPMSITVPCRGVTHKHFDASGPRIRRRS